MTINELNNIMEEYHVLSITIDFLITSYDTAPAKHLDNARYILCTLTENGIPRAVQSDEAARVRIQKPDKTYVYNDCDVTEDGRVLITLTEQILAVPGTACCDIQLSSVDGVIYSTKNFHIVIDEAAYLTDAIESSSEFNALNHLITDARQHIDTMNELENTVSENESQRNSEEANRVDAEVLRTESEAIRISNENIRISSEEARIASEANRQTAEIKREADTADAVSNADNAAQRADTAAQRADTAAENVEDTKSYADLKYSQSTDYTDLKVNQLINGAPETLDTLKEVADAIEENADIVDALNGAIGTKASQSELNAHSANNTIHITSSERTSWNSKAASDTKNTAGSTNSSSKLFLVGAPSQAANPQTYSNSNAYIGTDGFLYGVKGADFGNGMLRISGTGGVYIDGNFYLQSGEILYDLLQTMRRRIVGTSITLTVPILRSYSYIFLKDYINIYCFTCPYGTINSTFPSMIVLTSGTTYTGKFTANSSTASQMYVNYTLTPNSSNTYAAITLTGSYQYMEVEYGSQTTATTA